jgi:hypothetical protein
MGAGIPDGITRDDITRAVADFDAGVAHGFGQSTGYDRYDPFPVFPSKRQQLGSLRRAGIAVTETPILMGR